MANFLNRLFARNRAEAVEHEAEREQMSPAEREFDAESFEDRQADLSTAEHLGGVDPARLIDDGAPSDI